MDWVIEKEAPPLRADADGVIRVGGTRVTIDSVVYEFNDGATAEQIVQSYPSLSLSDVYAVIAHYLRHRKQVDEYLKDREVVAETVRRQVMERSNQKEIRQRLLARRSSKRQ